jgi:hypothetical protein
MASFAFSPFEMSRQARTMWDAFFRALPSVSDYYYLQCIYVQVLRTFQAQTSVRASDYDCHSSQIDVGQPCLSEGLAVEHTEYFAQGRHDIEEVCLNLFLFLMPPVIL